MTPLCLNGRGGAEARKGPGDPGLGVSEFPAFCPVAPFSGHCHLWLVPLSAAAGWAPFPLSLNGHSEAVGPFNYTVENPLISLSISPVLISSRSLPRVAALSQS